MLTQILREAWSEERDNDQEEAGKGLAESTKIQRQKELEYLSERREKMEAEDIQ